MSDNLESRRSGGNYKERLNALEDIETSDFNNPWNFYYLFLSDESTIQNWCTDNGLLARSIKCTANVNFEDTETGQVQSRTCGGLMILKPRLSKPDNTIFSCSLHNRHEQAYRTYSFFEKSNLTISDIMVFIKSYLDNLTLMQCARFTGIAYKGTAVNWASFIRELFKEFFSS